jgi:purine-nucleoside/S-methyl-5'-thioadenosine phosphorylase / adenosine deaminase
MTAVGGRTLAETPVGPVAFPRLELTEWAERFDLTAGVTLRGEGASLGLWSEENVGTVMTRWRAFLHSMHPDFPAVVLGHQVHGTTVNWHDPFGAGWLIADGVDGHATAASGMLLTVTVADCIPVYLADPGRRALALLHAGWRGVAGRILEMGLKVLREQAGSSPADIVMHCGVGICGSCYEVGPEVLQALSRPKGGENHVDLRMVLVEQATQLGILDVSVSPHCSSCDRRRFFSHRASGGRDGRMVAYLGSPAA